MTVGTIGFYGFTADALLPGLHRADVRLLDVRRPHGVRGSRCPQAGHRPPVADRHPPRRAARVVVADIRP